MTTSTKFVFYLTCLFLGKMALTMNLESSSSNHPGSRFLSVKTGQNVTLKCFIEGTFSRSYWYKQSLGEKPKLITSLYKYDKKAEFHNEFKYSRFTLDADKGKYHLKITDLETSDSATYYCASAITFNTEFKEGTIVDVQSPGLKVPALVQQSVSDTIQPGDSVTLNCTVHTGTCDGHHSVYWFRDSEESHPGLISTHGGSDDQCERKPETHTCVYKLPLKNLNESHAGTYYCAVVSCGHILFGDGTKLDFKDEVASLAVVYFLSGASAFATILSVLLAFSVCMMNGRNSQCTVESRARLPAPSTANTENYQHAEMLYYAAISFHQHNKSRGQEDDTWSESVYYRVK